MRVASWRISGGSDSRANRAIASKTAQSRWCAAVGRLRLTTVTPTQNSRKRFRFLSGKRPLSILEEPQMGPHSCCAPGSINRQAPLLPPRSYARFADAPLHLTGLPPPEDGLVVLVQARLPRSERQCSGVVRGNFLLHRAKVQTRLPTYRHIDLPNPAGPRLLRRRTERAPT